MFIVSGNDHNWALLMGLLYKKYKKTKKIMRCSEGETKNNCRRLSRQKLQTLQILWQQDRRYKGVRWVWGGASWGCREIQTALFFSFFFFLPESDIQLILTEFCPGLAASARGRSRSEPGVKSSIAPPPAKGLFIDDAAEVRERRRQRRKRQRSKRWDGGWHGA